MSTRAFTPGLEVCRDVEVSRRRELPMPGDVSVKIGDQVAPTDVIARTALIGEMRILRVCEELGVSPGELPKYLRVKIGDTVAVGDVVAEMRGFWGLFRSVVTTPMIGTVESVSDVTGHVGIRAPARHLISLPTFPGM